jgi:hypothetical protein
MGSLVAPVGQNVGAIAGGTIAPYFVPRFIIFLLYWQSRKMSGMIHDRVVVATLIIARNGCKAIDTAECGIQTVAGSERQAASKQEMDVCCHSHLF